MKHKISQKNNAQNKIVSKKVNYCKFCDKKIYGNAYKFNSHLFKHNVIKPRFECKHCDAEFYREDFLHGGDCLRRLSPPRRHRDRRELLKKVLGQDRNMSAFLIYFTYDTFLQHKNRHVNKTNIKTGRKYFCNYCNRGYESKRNLIKHLSTHDSSMPKFTIIRFTCEVCGISFTEKRVLQHHIRKAHFNHTDTEPTHVKRLVNDSWIEGVISTNVYVKMTKVNNNIISIKKCGTIKRDFNVATIDNDNIPSDKLNESHTIKRDHYNPFNYTNYSKAICDYCNKEMLKKSIEKHIRERHLKVRKFKCGVCNREFKRRYQLAQHVCGEEKKRRRRKPKPVTETKLKTEELK